MEQDNKNTQGTKPDEQNVNTDPKQGNEQNDDASKKQPTVDELSLQLAKANAEAARLKNSISKLTSENKKLSDWQKERMSAQEKQEKEDEEAKAEHDAYVKGLEDYKAINEASKRYIGMGMDVDLAIATATAETKGDMDTVMKNIKENSEAQIKAAKAEWLKSRPDIISGGTGKEVTKEQFDQMTIVERTKLYREDPDTYARLIGKK